MSDEPKESASQEMDAGFVDNGAESFSVDRLNVAETSDEDTGSSAPANEEDTDTSPVDEDIESDGTEDDEPEEDLPKGVQKRIGKLTRKFREQERTAQAEAERRLAAEDEAAALREKIAALERQSESTVVGEKPSIEDYDTEEEYLDALTDWKMESRFAKEREVRRKEREELAEESMRRAEDERTRRIQEALKKGAEKYSDFDDVIKDIQIPTAALSVFESLENAGDVAYELGKKPALASSLISMDPAQAGAKLFEISQSIKSRKVTKAPAPIRPVASKGGHIKSLENMSMAEYMAYRAKQDQKSRGF